MSAEEPWYVTAFRGGYREVYPHRDLAAARREAAWLVDRGIVVRERAEATTWESQAEAHGYANAHLDDRTVRHVRTA